MRRFTKFVVHALATLAVLPAIVLYHAAALVVGRERAFPFWTEGFALLPGFVGRYLRFAFYRRVLARCGENTSLGFGTTFSHPTASIGANVYIGSGCRLGDVTLEDDVLLGSDVSVMNGANQHGIDRLDVPVREQPGVLEPVTIGADSWIGERAIVAANVGRHCVVGAGSVVTKPLPDYAIAVGVPARVIRFRNTTDDPASVEPESPAPRATPRTPDRAASLDV